MQPPSYEPVVMSSWLQQQPSSHFYEEVRLQSLTRILPYTAKHNSDPIVTGLVQIFNTYSTKTAHIKKLYKSLKSCYTKSHSLAISSVPSCQKKKKQIRCTSSFAYFVFEKVKFGKFWATNRWRTPVTIKNRRPIITSG